MPVLFYKVIKVPAENYKQKKEGGKENKNGFIKLGAGSSEQLCI